MKAYDRVEWQYLEAIMLKMGFSVMWSSRIMKCVTSVNFSIRVNGEMLQKFVPSRGLRQGDPISPYLFLLCSEGFTALLKHFNMGFIDCGICVSAKSPWILHLLFADDSLILMEARRNNATRLDRILDIYNLCSGQKVNKEEFHLLQPEYEWSDKRKWWRNRNYLLPERPSLKDISVCQLLLEETWQGHLPFVETMLT